MKTIAIIQARIASSRLPGKVLADIAGKPMLLRIIERVAGARRVDQIIVATTTSKDDDVIVEYLNEVGACGVYRGAVDDVLARFVECVRIHPADIVVRVTADDPLKDPQIIDHAVGLLAGDPELDYCSNTIEPSYPEGLDIEVMRFRALVRAHLEATLASDREHVTPYIWRHPEWFRILNFKSDRDLSGWRWTVDEPEDLEFMQQVFSQFSGMPLVPYQEVVAWLDANPRVPLINSGIPRHEAYLNSLESETS